MLKRLLVCTICFGLAAAVTSAPLATATPSPTSTLSNHLQVSIFNAAGEQVQAIDGGAVTTLPSSFSLSPTSLVIGSGSTTLVLPGMAPSQALAWDGGTQGGAAAAPGFYYIKVSAVDAWGAPITWAAGLELLAAGSANVLLVAIDDAAGLRVRSLGTWGCTAVPSSLSLSPSSFTAGGGSTTLILTGLLPSQTLLWDGKLQDGSPAAPGTYTVNATAVDAAGRVTVMTSVGDLLPATTTPTASPSPSASPTATPCGICTDMLEVRVCGADGRTVAVIYQGGLTARPGPGRLSTDKLTAGVGRAFVQVAGLLPGQSISWDGTQGGRPVAAGTYTIQGRTVVGGDTFSLCLKVQAPPPAGRSVLGPVPVSGGGPLCLDLESPVLSSRWDIYTLDGGHVAHLDFGAQATQCWGTERVASGIFLVHLDILKPDGSREERWQKVAVLR